MERSVRVVRKIEDLQKQFNEARIQGVKSGDLTQAKKIQIEIEAKLTLVKENLSPMGRLHPELRQLVKKGRAEIMTVTVGGRDPEDILAELKEKEVDLGSWALAMMNKSEFVTLKQATKIDLLRFKTHGWFEKAFDLGLD